MTPARASFFSSGPAPLAARLTDFNSQARREAESIADPVGAVRRTEGQTQRPAMNRRRVAEVGNLAGAERL